MMNWFDVLSGVLILVLFLVLFFVPIFVVFNMKSRRGIFSIVNFFIFSILVALPVLFLLTWWIDYSNLLKLKHLGYELNSLDYSQVKESKLEKVKKIEISLMGIGWPLKAMFNLAFYSLWPLFVFFVQRFAIEQKA